MKTAMFISLALAGISALAAQWYTRTHATVGRSGGFHLERLVNLVPTVLGIVTVAFAIGWGIQALWGK